MVIKVPRIKLPDSNGVCTFKGVGGWGGTGRGGVFVVVVIHFSLGKKKHVISSFNFHATLSELKYVFVDVKGQFQECVGKMFPNKLFPSSFYPVSMW